MTSLYPKHEADTYGWARHTAELLRGRKMEEVDFENVIEEIEALGRSERRELISRLTVLLQHLLKWRYQPQNRTRSWHLTIQEQRMQVFSVLKFSPSLKNPETLEESMKDAYKIAVLKAARETELDSTIFPQECPHTFEEIMNEQFYPEA
jgi:hypothetical protein